MRLFPRWLQGRPTPQITCVICLVPTTRRQCVVCHRFACEQHGRSYVQLPPDIQGWALSQRGFQSHFNSILCGLCEANARAANKKREGT